MISLIKGLMAVLHRPIYVNRLNELARCITPHLKSGDQVLDVGCGSGMLGKALLDSHYCPNNVSVRGLERFKRGGEPIDVEIYDGVKFPYNDKTFDVVILADVLHHEGNQDHLLRESIRVSKRLLIIKDHQLNGPFAWLRVSFIDWAANSPYGVPCLYQYNTPTQWNSLRHHYGLGLVKEHAAMQLYPSGVNLFFGGKLQYMAVLQVPNI